MKWLIENKKLLLKCITCHFKAFLTLFSPFFVRGRVLYIILILIKISGVQNEFYAILRHLRPCFPTFKYFEFLVGEFYISAKSKYITSRFQQEIKIFFYFFRGWGSEPKWENILMQPYVIKI